MYVCLSDLLQNSKMWKEYNFHIYLMKHPKRNRSIKRGPHIGIQRFD